MRKFVRDNALSIALFAIFLITLVLTSFTGWKERNEHLGDRGRRPVALVQYLASPQLGRAVWANWEAEFLHLAFLIMVSVFLTQKGSPHSKHPEDEVNEDPRQHRNDPDAPWPVKRGGWPLVVYENSLFITITLIFLICFFMHGWTGRGYYNDQALEHGAQTVTFWQYMGTSDFWFDSLQNWQSEFLSVAAMAVLSIWLRQRGSAESKPVHTPHSEVPE